jgi:hypothetical protein
MCSTNQTAQVFNLVVRELLTSLPSENRIQKVVAHYIRVLLNREDMREALASIPLDPKAVKPWSEKKEETFKITEALIKGYLERQKGDIEFKSIIVCFLIGVATCCKICEEKLISIDKNQMPISLSPKMKELSEQMSQRVVFPLLDKPVSNLGGWCKLVPLTQSSDNSYAFKTFLTAAQSLAAILRLFLERND